MKRLLLSLAAVLMLAGIAIAGANAVTASLTTQNTFTDAKYFYGSFNVSIEGTWGGTLTLQRTFNGTTWYDVASFTANTEDGTYWEPEPDVAYRIGFKTGSSPTGTALVRLSQ